MGDNNERYNKNWWKTGISVKKRNIIYGKMKFKEAQKEREPNKE